jgi:hypothetical protein
MSETNSNFFKNHPGKVSVKIVLKSFLTSKDGCTSVNACTGEIIAKITPRAKFSIYVFNTVVSNQVNSDHVLSFSCHDV